MNTLLKLTLVLAVSGGLTARAGVLSVLPAASTTHVGDAVALDIAVTGALDLYTYQFDVGFDPSKLAADFATEGPFLAGAGATAFFPGFIDNSAGTVSFLADSLIGPIPGANGSGVLLTITFHAVGSGSAPVDIFNVTALDSFGAGIVMTTGGATVQVEANGVPEPGTAILAAVVALALLARRARAFGS